jgi:hypothetical protein
MPRLKKRIVLVNEGTASSADDFTFRMKEFGKAYVMGQPHSADLTYAFVMVLFYLDGEGKIQKKYFGNRQREYEVDGKEVLKFSIPLSRTVDSNGNMLQGNPVLLNKEIELTKENFETRELSVLNSVVKTWIN